MSTERAEASISLRTGRHYRISFLAKSVGGTGTVQVRLTRPANSRDALWTSETLHIGKERGEYAAQYVHTGPDVDDVRLAFLLGKDVRTVLLDRIALHGHRD